MCSAGCELLGWALFESGLSGVVCFEWCVLSGVLWVACCGRAVVGGLLRAVDLCLCDESGLMGVVCLLGVVGCGLMDESGLVRVVSLGWSGVRGWLGESGWMTLV